MSNNYIALNGINGSNPLGFLATIGTINILSRSSPQVKLSWNIIDGSWRPLLWDCYTDKSILIENIFTELNLAPMDVFSIDNKFPYEVNKFTTQTRAAYENASSYDRRSLDFLAAYGCEILKKKDKNEDIFLCTKFCMIRRGDSAGNGLLAYIRVINEAFTNNKDCLNRTLFETWDYADNISSLRWDPIEDQRYALRWDDPSPAKKKTMLGANRLAVEALPLFPSVPQGNNLLTTGFNTINKETSFSWPIWSCKIGINSIRSLLALSDLQNKEPDRGMLNILGVKEVFRCQRIAPNQYYKNFLPAVPK